MASNPVPPGTTTAATASPPVSNMSAYQMVQELSPFVKFAHFAANQAILEAAGGDLEVHIVDFDVMDGIQWPPLMVDLLASRNGAASLRITAVVALEANAETARRTGRRLAEFAGSIGLALRFDQVEAKDLEWLQVCKGSVVANCMLQESRTPSKSSAQVKDFLNKARKLSPKLVVVVEEELFSSRRASAMAPPPSSFVEFFCDALHHFSSVSDSLGCSFYGAYRVGLRLVEEEMLGPRIIDCVGCFPFGPLIMDGFRLAPLSSCNVSQVKFLLGLFNMGFGLQTENGRLALCWKSRPLI